jgi:hypothetical protein
MLATLLSGINIVRIVLKTNFFKLPFYKPLKQNDILNEQKKYINFLVKILETLLDVLNEDYLLKKLRFDMKVHKNLKNLWINQNSHGTKEKGE